MINISTIKNEIIFIISIFLFLIIVNDTRIITKEIKYIKILNSIGYILKLATKKSTYPLLLEEIINSKSETTGDIIEHITKILFNFINKNSP